MQRAHGTSTLSTHTPPHGYSTGSSGIQMIILHTSVLSHQLLTLLSYLMSQTIALHLPSKPKDFNQATYFSAHNLGVCLNGDCNDSPQEDVITITKPFTATLSFSFHFQSLGFFLLPKLSSPLGRTVLYGSLTSAKKLFKNHQGKKGHYLCFQEKQGTEFNNKSLLIDIAHIVD